MGRADHKAEDAIRGKWAVLDNLLRPETTSSNGEEQKGRRKAEYDAVNRLMNGSRVGKYSHFLNYGYVANDQPSFARFIPAASHFDAASRRLVLEVLGDAPLDGADVLDVSCGRGAVAVTLRDYFTPGSYLGIDLSPEAIAFCSRQHARASFDFREGDAEALPLPDASFDAVVNVEASHNYPNPPAFFAEVRRVLRPGGWFLYTDMLPPAAFERYAALIREQSFECLRDVDITANVLLASDLVGEMRARVYRDEPEQEYMNDFVAAPGSETYCAWKDGRLQYRLYTFRLPI
jgi:phthiocerol/phenolphthiocerol synthesis type-I polyketide synthase E